VARKLYFIHVYYGHGPASEVTRVNETHCIRNKVVGKKFSTQVKNHSRFYKALNEKCIWDTLPTLINRPITFFNIVFVFNYNNILATFSNRMSSRLPLSTLLTVDSLRILSRRKGALPEDVSVPSLNRAMAGRWTRAVTCTVTEPRDGRKADQGDHLYRH